MNAAAQHPMRRHCFQLQLRPERITEYRERHAAVWPEMLEALRDTGWHNYSLFVREDGLLIGYVETASFDQARNAMSEREVNARWQAAMAEFFVDLDDERPDSALVELTEVFHLEDQLAALPSESSTDSLHTAQDQ